jgi:hypothetical protein
LLYLRRVQLMRQAATPPTLLALQEQRAVMPDALIATERLVDQIERVADDPPVEIIDTFQMARQRVRQGVQALAAFYRLVDLFPPGTKDNHEPVLRRAVLDLLREFVQLRDSHVVDDELAEQRGASRARSTGCSPTPLRRCGRRPCRRPSPPCRPGARRGPRRRAARLPAHHAWRGVAAEPGHAGSGARLLDAALAQARRPGDDAAPGSVYRNLASPPRGCAPARWTRTRSSSFRRNFARAWRRAPARSATCATTTRAAGGCRGASTASMRRPAPSRSS